MNDDKMLGNDMPIVKGQTPMDCGSTSRSAAPVTGENQQEDTPNGMSEDSHSLEIQLVSSCETGCTVSGEDEPVTESAFNSPLGIVLPPAGTFVTTELEGPVVHFNSPSGDYTEPFQVDVTSSDSGAIVRFTVDGSDPTGESAVWDGRLRVDQSMHVKARAFIADRASGPIAAVNFRLVVAAPTFSPGAGIHYPPVTVRIASATLGVTIRTTVDGNDPAEGGVTYRKEEGLFIAESATVRAVAAREGWEAAESQAEFTMKAPEWQTLEPKDASDPVPHEEHHQQALAAGWHAVGASTRGRLHAHNGSYREDSFAWKAADAWNILVVADGAGSAELSRVGSSIASTTAASHFAQHLEGFHLSPVGVENEDGSCRPSDSDLLKLRTFLVEAANEVQRNLRREAAQRGKPLESLATTFLLATSTPWQGLDLVAALQVGDGIIALLTDDDAVTLLGTADHGQQASETRFITTKNVEHEFPHRVAFTVKTGLVCIAAMTDGVADDFFPEEQRMIDLFHGAPIGGMATKEGQPVNGVMQSVLRSESPAEALSNWLRYEKRGSSDDRTLALFWRPER